MAAREARNFFEQFFGRYRMASMLRRRGTSPVAARLECEEGGRECIQLFWAADGNTAHFVMPNV